MLSEAMSSSRESEVAEGGRRDRGCCAFSLCFSISSLGIRLKNVRLWEGAWREKAGKSENQRNIPCKAMSPFAWTETWKEHGGEGTSQSRTLIIDQLQNMSMN